jgi:SAM-dependent methyltransferase
MNCGNVVAEGLLKFELKRGAVFDAAAIDYDTYRPSYPVEVVREVVSLSNLRSSSRLLEIGCGTGKATMQFASRGYMIDCVDPGRNLVALARRNCQRWQNVSFKIGKFEEVDFDVLSYDLIYSAQAFHWIDPAVRLQKTARLLAHEGSLALLYNYPGRHKDSVLEELGARIKKETRGKLNVWDYGGDVANWVRELKSCGLFKKVKLLKHKWVHEYDAERYAGLFRTYSDFLSLPRTVQQKVMRRIEEVINRNGGHVRRSYDCVLIHAQRKPGRL